MCCWNACNPHSELLFFLLACRRWFCVEKLEKLNFYTFILVTCDNVSADPPDKTLLPDFVGKLLLWPIPAPQLPEENCQEGQQDEDEEQRTHDGADDHAGSVGTWNGPKNQEQRI